MDNPNLIPSLQSSLLSENFFEKIQTCKSNEECIQLMLEINEKYKTEFPKLPVQQKDTEKSKYHRNEGNQFYSKGDLINAQEQYVKSISMAPCKSTELALAYANLSAVLFRLEKYEDCVRVIDRCLSLNYPDDLKLKLLLRKVECLVTIGSLRASKCYDETREWIKRSIADLKEQHKMMTKVEKIYQTKKKATIESEQIDMKQLFKNLYYEKTNAEIPASSDSVSLKYDDKFGRHLVASRDIRPGEILACELPYFMVLAMDKRYSNCWKCLKPIRDCVACDRCTVVVYCSDECKQRAWEEFHSIECDVLPLMPAHLHTNGPANLRLIILAVRELGGIRKLAEEVRDVDLCKDPRLKGFTKDGKYHSNKYRSIYSLSVAEFANTDQRCLFYSFYYSALLLYTLATQTTFFGRQLKKWKDLRMNEDVTFIGSLILRNEKILHTNGFAAKDPLFEGDVKIGIKMYAFCSFLNHSCRPNIARCYIWDYTYLYAAFPIKEGEQLFISYTFDYPYETKLRRQMDLRCYSFTCECIACRENWSLIDQLPEADDLIQFNGLDLLPNWYEFIKGTKEMEVYMMLPILDFVFSSEDIPIIFERLRDGLEVMLKFIPLPCKEVEILVEKMRRVFEWLNFYKEKKSISS